MIRDRNILVIILFFTILTVALFALSPSDEELILKRMNQLAVTLSFDTELNSEKQKSKLNKLKTIFAKSKPQVHIKPKYRELTSLNSLADIQNHSLSLFTIIKSLKLTFSQYNISFAKKDSSLATLKTKAVFHVNANKQSVTAPLHILFKEISRGDWRIQSITTPENEEIEI